MFRVKWWFRRKWWQFRHKVYYYDVPVPPPVSPTGGDDTAMIQNAIDVAASVPAWFTAIYAAYQRKWYRFLLRKPVLGSSVVKFQAGTYVVGSPLVIGDGVHIEGQGPEHSTIKYPE